MTSDRARLWQQLMKLTPVCSGSLHEQYLPCGKPNCSCHDKAEPKLHGPYYLWVRRIGGKQINRTLKPGPELDKVREGIGNYRKMQELMGELLSQEEALVLEGERASVGKGKKTSRRDFSGGERIPKRPDLGYSRQRANNRQWRRGGTLSTSRSTSSWRTVGVAVEWS